MAPPAALAIGTAAAVATSPAAAAAATAAAACPELAVVAAPSAAAVSARNHCPICQRLPASGLDCRTSWRRTCSRARLLLLAFWRLVQRAVVAAARRALHTKRYRLNHSRIGHCCWIVMRSL